VAEPGAANGSISALAFKVVLLTLLVLKVGLVLVVIPTSCRLGKYPLVAVGPEIELGMEETELALGEGEVFLPGRGRRGN